MRLNSLALRLFLSATTWTVVILLVTGIVLSSIYRAAVERAFDRRLGVYLRSLVADVATPEENARRPAAKTALRNVCLAGDWTDTGLPATIEGAIRSGNRAADLAGIPRALMIEAD